jgi:hypothetical protein
MNFRTEFFVSSQWADTTGLIFATKQEAIDYARSVFRVAYRVVETQEPANYAWNAGRLSLVKAPMSMWQKIRSLGGAP